MLNHRADWQTVLYLLAALALPLLQWQLETVNPILFLTSLAMAFAVGAMHHNHSHVPIWRSGMLNHLTDYCFTLLQGHPGYVFFPAHLDNHHRYVNRAEDYTRTYRRRDDNNLIGLALHPLESAWTLLPVVKEFLHVLWHERRTRFWKIFAHYLFLVGCIAIAFAIDWYKALLFVVTPQLAALFFLLASNYFQHAHTDETSSYSHSRNFLGWINPLFFNVGYHTAHHQDDRVHWSCLPQVHERISDRIDPRLIEKSFAWYCLRVFVLGALMPSLRSASLRQPDQTR